MSRTPALWAWLNRGRLWLGAAVVALVSGFSFASSLGHGFIYDDYWTVVGNTHLNRPLGELTSLALSGRAVVIGVPDATRPAMSLSLWVDRRLFGLDPLGYHIHSLVLYAVVGVAVYALAVGVLRRWSTALCAGLCFAVMPLHAEVVSAVNYREDLYAALGVFGASAVLFWPWARSTSLRVYGCSALWLIGLAGKESALVLPMFCASLALLRRPSRLSLRGPGSPFIGASAVLVLWLNWRLGLWVLGEQIPRADYGGFWTTALATFRFEAYSVLKSFCPVLPHPEYEPMASADWRWLVVGAAIGVVAFWMLRRRVTRAPAAAIMVALTAPLVTSPLLAPVNERADRYWFVGSFAAALLVAWAFEHVRRLHRTVAWSALGACLAVGVLLCWRASAVWASEASLWTAAVESAPGSARAWSQLSRAHRLAGQEDLAQWAVERSLQLKPSYVPAHVGQVLNLLWAGHLDEARAALARVEPESALHRKASRVASRCAQSATAELAQACARKTVPRGLVLGDRESLRRFSVERQ